MTGVLCEFTLTREGQPTSRVKLDTGEEVQLDQAELYWNAVPIRFPSLVSELALVFGAGVVTRVSLVIDPPFCQRAEFST